MNCELRKLGCQGMGLPSDDQYDEDLFDNIPEEFNPEKFEKGRQFFITHVSQCLMAMFFSLVCGLSVNNLLDVLVATGETTKPRDSAKRYIRTTQHVLKWHYGNVWDAESSAAGSIRAVRKVHCKTRKYMERKNGESLGMRESDHHAENGKQTNLNGDVNSHNPIRKVELSQYDMSLVQCGFMGAIIMYPGRFGIRCTTSDLDNYVYYWRWLAYLLGMNNTNNICYEGFDKAHTLCKAIETDILIPSLHNPPKHYFPMARAASAGLHFGSPEYMIALLFEAVGEESPYPLDLADRARIVVFRTISLMHYYVPGFSWCMNKGIEMVFGCHHMT